MFRDQNFENPPQILKTTQIQCFLAHSYGNIEVEQCIYSLGDHSTYLRFNRVVFESFPILNDLMRQSTPTTYSKKTKK